MKDREQSRIEEIGHLHNALNHSEAKCEQLTAALEAAEAKFEEARADNHRMALELADLLCERKELRARVSRLEREVAGLEGMVPKWVPVSERLPKDTYDPATGANGVIAYVPSLPDNLFPITVASAAWVNGPHSKATHWMPLPTAPKEEADHD